MSEPTVHFEGSISDWRVSQNATEDLTGDQQKAWPVKLTSGGYGGLSLEFTAPDGTSRSVAIEIDQGNLKLAVFRDSDDLDAIVTVQEDGVHVQSNVGGQSSYLFNEDGVTRSSDKPTPSFGTEGGAPAPR